MICFMSLYGQLVDVHGKPLPMNARSSTWSRPATFPKFRRQRSPFANTVTVELPRRSVGALACYPVHSEMSPRKSCRPRAAVVGRTGFVDARGNTPSFLRTARMLLHTLVCFGAELGASTCPFRARRRLQTFSKTYIWYPGLLDPRGDSLAHLWRQGGRP